MSSALLQLQTELNISQFYKVPKSVVFNITALGRKIHHFVTSQAAGNSFQEGSCVPPAGRLPLRWGHSAGGKAHVFPRIVSCSEWPKASLAHFPDLFTPDLFTAF